jgi:hypothetical protein
VSENGSSEDVMGENRILLGLLVLLGISACRDPAIHPDGAVATGGSGGAGSSAGSGGSGPGGGSGGTGIDAATSGGSDGGDEDGPAGVPDAFEGGIALEPIRVSGGNPDASVAYHDVRFVGVGLEQYEGAVVTFRIGSSTGFWRLGSGQVRIVGGAFDVLFREVLPPTYQLKLAHIDADGSGACEVGEPAFVDQAVISTDVTLTVTPDDFRFRPAATYWCGAVNDWPIPP